MRKFFALAMVAVLSLTIGLAAIGCGQKTEQTETSTPPAETSTMPADTGSSMMSDTMSHMADTTAAK